jgi:hypothetical protein
MATNSPKNFVGVTGTVPEPNTLMLAVLATVMVGSLRRSPEADVALRNVDAKAG